MLRPIVLILTASMLLGGASAQDDAPRLRVPTPEEYVSLAADIGATLWSPLMIAEAEERYGERLAEASYDTLGRALDRLPIMFEGDQSVWENARLIAWIRENDVDLSGVESLKFDDYDIQIIPADFDGDGTTDYAADVLRGCSSDVERCRSGADDDLADHVYHTIVVLSQQGRGNHIAFSSPFLWTGNWRPNQDYASGALYLWEVRDVTGDAVPELLAVWTSRGYIVWSALRILGLQDERLMDLTEYQLGFRYFRTTDLPLEGWTFLPDASPAQVIQEFAVRDNWQCERREVEHYEWDGNIFVPVQPESVYPDSFACEIRQAEQAVLNGDYIGAQQHYAAAFEHQTREAYETYSAVRFVLATALAGDVERAGAMLQRLYADAITAGGDESHQLSEWIIALWNAYQKDTTAIHLCLTAYNFAVENPFYLSDSVPAEVGEVFDETRGFSVSGIHPSKMSCNAISLLDTVLTSHSFPSNEDPTAQLEALGWPIQTSLHGDLNGDGIDDWLVWIDNPMLHPMLFASTETTFIASRFTRGVTLESRYPYPLSEDYQAGIVELPNGEKVLALLDYVLIGPYMQAVLPEISNEHSHMRCAGVAEGEPRSALGELTLWRLENSSLVEILSTLVCGLGTIEDFISGSQIRGRNWPGSSDETITMFVWDATQRTFVEPTRPSATATPNSILDLGEPRTFREAVQVYRAGRFEALLAMDEDLILIDIRERVLESIRPSTYGQDVIIQIEPASGENPIIGYLRALALEGLGHEDEAAAQFAAIAGDDSHPEWAALAALHLEPAD